MSELNADIYVELALEWKQLIRNAVLIPWMGCQEWERKRKKEWDTCSQDSDFPTLCLHMGSPSMEGLWEQKYIQDY